MQNISIQNVSMQNVSKPISLSPSPSASFSKAGFVLCNGLIGCFAFGLAACATAPTPEEVCSTQWISQRTDKAMSEFERDVRPMMRTFRRAGRVAERGDVLGAFQTLRLVNSVTKMLDKIQDSQALKDVQTLGKTCNDPDLLADSFTNFMREQGASDQVIGMIDTVRGLLPNDAR